ncbi:hypothetical protein H0R92_03860 [Treponema sp. OMZ 840]|uniref:hypothetical protein n=1 Tax=Treponema sp. OMZ 840 TaxID=244313 RepID=UPI003D92CB10
MEKLAVVIIPEHYADNFIAAAGTFHTGQFFVLSGKGTASLLLLQRLGLGTTKKAVIAFFSSQATLSLILNTWEKEVSRYKDCTGILFTVLTENLSMAKKSKHTLICAIVNSGCGELLMQAARKAGAPGGTIIDGRGTGTEADMNFFGIQIVPEKEVVLIISETAAAGLIEAEIKKLSCFEKPGSGILCTLPVDSCTHLGAPLHG